jgi:hypothetical protein
MKHQQHPKKTPPQIKSIILLFHNPPLDFLNVALKKKKKKKTKKHK